MIGKCEVNEKIVVLHSKIVTDRAPWMEKPVFHIGLVWYWNIHTIIEWLNSDCWVRTYYKIEKGEFLHKDYTPALDCT